MSCANCPCHPGMSALIPIADVVRPSRQSGEIRLEADEMALLIVRCQTKIYRAGETLFRQGETPQYFFYVQSGVIKVKHSTGAGRDLIIELLFPGDVCGALCALDEAPYAATAISLGDARVGRMPRTEFAALMLAHPGIWHRATVTCRDKMGQQLQGMVGLALERAEQRLARLFLLLARRLGQTVAGVIRIPRLLDRQDVSELIGTSVETAIRTFSRFRSQGWIEEDEDSLDLCDLSAITEMAGIS